MRRPQHAGGVTALTEPNGLPEYAPSFNALDEYGFINGNLRAGGIYVWSKDEAVLLAEELLDWAYGPAPKEPSKKTRKRKPKTDPMIGRKIMFVGSGDSRQESSKNYRIIQKAKDAKYPDRYDLECPPDSGDYSSRTKRFKNCNVLRNDLGRMYAAMPGDEPL